MVGARVADPPSLVQALRIGERAAFHSAPLDGVAPLRALQRRRSSARLAWLTGVCLGAAGRYGAAIEALTPVAALDSARRPTPEDDACVASLASSTLGSLYRQLGRHEEARVLDDRAIEYVTPHLASSRPGAVAALVDARLGLAADAVGLHELGRAELELAAAIRSLPGAGRARMNSPDAWRIRARSCWVRAEVALLHGDAPLALIAARESVRLARAARAPRHEAKGLLFAGVAEAGSGRINAARDTALASLRLSVSLGAWPLVWPAALVLSDLLLAGPLLDQALELGLVAVDVIGSDLPGPLAHEWCGGADVQRLVQRTTRAEP